MKKKSNSQQLMLLIVVLSILAVVLVYMFVYKDFQNRAAAKRSSNQELQQKVDQLKEYYENQNDYVDKTAELKTEIRSAMAQFPTLALEEDIMMQAHNSMLEADELAYTSIAIAAPESFFVVPAELFATAKMSVNDDDNTNNEQAMLFFDRKASYVAQCNYPSLKSMIKDMVDRPYKNKITNILFEKDKELNALNGTMEIAMFYVPLYGEEYVPVDMNDYIKGLEDLFKLVKHEEETEEE